MTARIDFLTLAFCLAIAGGNVAFSQEFRVDTDLYLDEETEPISETLTLFSNGMVYDFILTGPEEITIFDVDRGNIVLLDIERKLKSSLTTKQLVAFCAKVQVLAQGDKRMSPLFFPEFSTTFDTASRELELASPRLTYRVTGMSAKIPEGVQQFRQFADWYARLNAMRPNNLPPFARMELNAALSQRDLVPQEIARETVIDGRFGVNRMRVRSTHSFVWKLSTTDGKRIDRANRYRAEFTSAASLTDYWKTPALANR